MPFDNKNIKSFDFKGRLGSYCHSMDCEESQVEPTKKNKHSGPNYEIGISDSLSSGIKE